tara:strand:+ start:2877 stop:3560 length:684 start_codon:yes stop_codon:yes gene_type:complete
MTIKDWHNNYIREGKTYNEKREVGKKQWGGKITKPDFFVYDNFYNNPMHMRAWALSLDFNVTGNYPGLRTKPYPYENWGTHIEHIMNVKIDKEIWNNDMFNGAFQSVEKDTRTWVHADITREYTCIVFLNPFAPPNTGTSFYEHRETGSRVCDEDTNYINEVSTEYGPNNLKGSRDDVWRRVDTISNKFNRAIIFKGNLWHAADDYFGWDLETSRLTQTFFFDTEDE